MIRFRRFKVPDELRRPLGIILGEITKPPQRRNKTAVYHRGVSDGVLLVRKRAQQMGISLEEPFIEVPTEVTLVVVKGGKK